MAKSPPGTPMKTAVFKIHNPSKKKQAMMRDALRRSHLAYSKALQVVSPHLDAIKRLKNKGERVKEIERLARPIIRSRPLSSAIKAGLLQDVSGQISSFVELSKLADKKNAVDLDRDENIEATKLRSVSPPTAARLDHAQDAYAEALDALASAGSLEAENAARDQVLSEIRSGQTRPALFPRFNPKNGFVLLSNEENTRLYAYLNLHPKDSRFAQPTRITDLVDIRTGEVVNFASRTGVLLPLEYSARFQVDRFLRLGVPKSAKLVERSGHFELHVSFAFAPLRVPPSGKFLGIDRGIHNLCSLAVVDTNGVVVESLNFDGKGLRDVQRKEERKQRQDQSQGKKYLSRKRRHSADEAVHVAANKIVELAAKHGAQVVVENLGNLTDRTKKRKRSNFNRVMTRAQYSKLLAVLEYKLKCAGLFDVEGRVIKARLIEVNAAFTSQTCPECGLYDKANRTEQRINGELDRSLFACIHCGHEDDADLNAARVIALKGMWASSLTKADWEFLKKDKQRISLHYEAFLRACSEKRRQDGCDR